MAFSLPKAGAPIIAWASELIRDLRREIPQFGPGFVVEQKASGRHVSLVRDFMGQGQAQYRPVSCVVNGEAPDYVASVVLTPGQVLERIRSTSTPGEQVKTWDPTYGAKKLSEGPVIPVPVGKTLYVKVLTTPEGAVAATPTLVSDVDTPAGAVHHVPPLDSLGGDDGVYFLPILKVVSDAGYARVVQLHEGPLDWQPQVWQGYNMSGGAYVYAGYSKSEKAHQFRSIVGENGISVTEAYGEVRIGLQVESTDETSPDTTDGAQAMLPASFYPTLWEDSGTWKVTIQDGVVRGRLPGLYDPQEVATTTVDLVAGTDTHIFLLFVFTDTSATYQYVTNASATYSGDAHTPAKRTMVGMLTKNLDLHYESVVTRARYPDGPSDYTTVVNVNTTFETDTALGAIGEDATYTHQCTFRIASITWSNGVPSVRPRQIGDIWANFRAQI